MVVLESEEFWCWLHNRQSFFFHNNNPQQLESRHFQSENEYLSGLSFGERREHRRLKIFLIFLIAINPSFIWVGNCKTTSPRDEKSTQKKIIWKWCNKADCHELIKQQKKVKLTRASRPIAVANAKRKHSEP